VKEMKHLSGVVAFAVMTAAAAQAASNVSAKFDGRYAGIAAPAPLSPVACSTLQFDHLAISGGFVSTPRGGSDPISSGFITEEGYFTAIITRPGHRPTPMDGRLVDGTIIAGVMECDSGCAWVIHLERKPQT